MGTCSGKCQSHSNCVAIKFQTCISHSMIQGRGGWVIYVNKQFYCDFKDLKYSVWICIQIFVLTSNWLHVHDSHQVQRRSNEQVISMITKSKTAIAHKLLSVQEKMNVINMGGRKLDRQRETERERERESEWEWEWVSVCHSRTLHFNVVSTHNMRHVTTCICEKLSWKTVNEWTTQCGRISESSNQLQGAETIQTGPHLWLYMCVFLHWTVFLTTISYSSITYTLCKIYIYIYIHTIYLFILLVHLWIPTAQVFNCSQKPIIMPYD